MDLVLYVRYCGGHVRMHIRRQLPEQTRKPSCESDVDDPSSAEHLHGWATMGCKDMVGAVIGSG